MTRILEALRQRIVDLLRDLDARPWSLFCVLVAANAVALPYANFHHDANLYGVQVLNRVDLGRFSGDLFFQFGSQDNYSLFSLVAAPVVARLGLPAGFFVLYILTNSLFLFALQRFVRAIVKAPIVSTVTLLFLAINLIPFGGLGIFHVNESFLTPRIAANALVLLGLERLIAGRVLPAWGLVLMGLPLHPLMAFPGVLILASWLALTRLGLRWFLGLLTLSALAAAVVVLERSVGLRLLGAMDEAWRDNVRRANPYLFPLDWRADDWLRIAVSFAIVLETIRNCRPDDPVRRLLLAMSWVAAIGLVGSLAACFLPFALPLQGQAYRWLWPLELTLYPLGFLVVRRLWATRYAMQRLAAIGLLAYLSNLCCWNNPDFLMLALDVGLLGVVVWRGMSPQPYMPDWKVRAAIFALALTLPLWIAIKLGFIAAYWQQLCSLLEPIEMLGLLTSVVDPLCRLALLIGALVLMGRFAASARRLIMICSGAWLTACFVFFVLPQTGLYSDIRATHVADERFVAEYLARSQTPGAVPTIYWPYRKIAFIWFKLRANIYFQWPHHIAGNVFSAGTAREGARRAQMVKKFEVERLRKERILYPPWLLTPYLSIVRATEDEPAPEADDLLRLCREPRLDFIILPQEFPGLYSATNGKCFIYDCRSIRASLGHETSAVARNQKR
jgi:hypothetical protein